MTCETFPNLLALADRPEGLTGPQGKQVRVMLAVSVAIHLGLLAVTTNLRWAPSFERPLASYQVSLIDPPSPSHPARPVSREAPARPVAMPAPVVPPRASASVAPNRLSDLPSEKRAEAAPPAKPSPIPFEPLPPLMPGREPRSPMNLREALRGMELPPEIPKAPQAAPARAAPSASRAAPSPPPSPLDDRVREALQGIALPPEIPKAPQAAPARAAPSASRAAPSPPPSPLDDRVREALQGITLPPDAPKLEELRTKALPAKPASPPPRKDIRTHLRTLKVPEAPILPAPSPEAVKPGSETSPRPSLAEELAQQLARLQSPPSVSAKPGQPNERHPAAPSTAQGAENTVAAKPPEGLKPGVRMQVEGLAPGFSQYLARVQNEISKKWVAPQVEAPEGALQVVIKFRLHRSGTVSQVEIERTSGNDYYDLAGKRAVMSAFPLPPFPSGMPHVYLDAHFSFTVSGPSG